MPDLSFIIEDAQAMPLAATPLLHFQLRIDNADSAERIHAVLLRCQIQLEVTRRRYSEEEQRKLYDLFGPASQWGRTLRNMLWTHSDINVPGFVGHSTVPLPVSCSYDLTLASTKYLDALGDAELPLCFLFSGTVFYASGQLPLQVAPISWERECRYQLPVRTWREMINQYYPNSAWLTLRKDVFDRLARYKSEHALPSWEQTIESLLPPVTEQA